MPFAGRNHLFLGLNKFFCIFPSLTGQKRGKYFRVNLTVLKPFLSLYPHIACLPNIRARPRAGSRAAPSLEAHHRSHGPNRGSNSGGKQTINKKTYAVSLIGLKVSLKFDNEST